MVDMPTNFSTQEILRERARRQNLPYTIRLQAIGEVPAVFVHELRVGDRMVFNFGYTYKITAIDPVSSKFVKVAMASERDGSEYSQRMKLDKLVARLERTGNRFDRINRGS